MSTDIVKSMSIDFKGMKQKFKVASSNVWPRTYEDCTIEYKPVVENEKLSILSEEEKFILPLVRDLSGGMIRLNKSVSAKYRYAFHKMIEKRDAIYNENPDAFEDGYGCTHPWEVMRETLEDGTDNMHNVQAVVQAFIEGLREKDEKINKVITFGGNYLNRINPSSVRHVRDKSMAKVYTSKKALILDMEDIGLRFSNMEIGCEDL